MKHVELNMLAVQEWLKTGRLRVRKVSTHDNLADLMTKAKRETDQVRTSFELTRITLHRLEPTCTAAMTSTTSITETLTVEMNTVNSFQHHKLTACGGNLRTTTMKTGIDMSPQPSTSNSIDVSAKMQTVEQIAGVPIPGRTK